MSSFERHPDNRETERKETESYISSLISVRASVKPRCAASCRLRLAGKPKNDSVSETSRRRLSWPATAVVNSVKRQIMFSQFRTVSWRALLSTLVRCSQLTFITCLLGDDSAPVSVCSRRLSRATKSEKKNRWLCVAR